MKANFTIVYLKEVCAHKPLNQGHRDLRIPSIRRFVTTALFIIFLAAIGVSCGSNNDDTVAPAQEEIDVATATVVPPTQDPIVGSGLDVGEVTVDSGKFGGKVLVEVSNTSESACAGLVVNFDLLAEDGKLVAQIGAIGSPLAVGGKQTIKTRFIGSGVTVAKVSAITCDNSRISDTGAPDRAHTPVPGK
jgi:hypothetical protein